MSRLRADKDPKESLFISACEAFGERPLHCRSADSADSDAVLIEAKCADLHYTARQVIALDTNLRNNTIKVICTVC